MQKINKIILISIFLLTSAITYAQDNLSSPYTQFGIGDLINKNYGWSTAMGGIGNGLRSSKNLNYKNPASYTAIDTMSFLFTVGVKSKITQFKTINDNFTTDNTNINFLSIGFPITRWLKSSIGLSPYSRVGYSFVDTIEYENIGKTKNYSYGSGGLNQFYFGNSVELFKKLSIGFNLSYLFGSIKQTNTLIFSDVSGALNTQKEDVIRASDFFLNYGIQYYDKLNDKLNYTLGVSFENKNVINASYSSLKATTIGNFTHSLDNNILIDTISYTYREHDNFILPQEISFGFSVNYNRKLMIGADYTIQSWQDSKILGQKDSLANSNSIAFGMEYVPNRFSTTKYYKRMRYRLGGHITNSYIQIYDNQIKDYGLSFGLGIPINRLGSNANISFSFGKRGTTENNLILENYGILSLSVSLSDIWFIKRKFD
ncbi:MAG: hypothetical protein GXO79_14645 [Chlorobi bacterium]|nr:hypothetical protein [Chlorobiota bacterium]